METKYQYHVQLWGGFYNPEFAAIHGEKEGDYLFDSFEEREAYINKLKAIESELDAKYLMVKKTEGYNCNIRTIIHRVTKFKGKEYYTTRDLGINYLYEDAIYMLENKWYPGHNDYPLGDNFDYSREDYECKEWITGAFQYGLDKETIF